MLLALLGVAAVGAIMLYQRWEQASLAPPPTDRLAESPWGYEGWRGDRSYPGSRYTSRRLFYEQLAQPRDDDTVLEVEPGGLPQPPGARRLAGIRRHENGWVHELSVWEAPYDAMETLAQHYHAATEQRGFLALRRSWESPDTSRLAMPSPGPPVNRDPSRPPDSGAQAGADLQSASPSPAPLLYSSRGWTRSFVMPSDTDDQRQMLTVRISANDERSSIRITVWLRYPDSRPGATEEDPAPDARLDGEVPRP